RSGRQHGQERKCECLADPAWSKTLACRYALCTGTGRSPTWPLQQSWSGPHREGEESKPMKHGQEKSDLFIIALKPTNKHGRPGAELVEPRKRTEGNMGEQHTYRTLCRINLQGARQAKHLATLKKLVEREQWPWAEPHTIFLCDTPPI